LQGKIKISELLKKIFSEDLFKLAIDNNWSILESKKETVSLEDVFRKLTTKE